MSNLSTQHHHAGARGAVAPVVVNKSAVILSLGLASCAIAAAFLSWNLSNPDDSGRHLPTRASASSPESPVGVCPSLLPKPSGPDGPKPTLNQAIWGSAGNTNSTTSSLADAAEPALKLRPVPSGSDVSPTTHPAALSAAHR